MHGPPLLQDPTTSYLIIAGAVVLFSVFVWRTKRYKGDPYNIQPKISGHKILDTGDIWIWFTLSIGMFAAAAHFLAEYSFHLYDITSIDKFTHGLSGMAITAFILNFNLTRGRKVYYPVSIGITWLAFIAWEVYEWVAVLTTANSGIQTTPLDMAVDLWVDSLGALAICFLYDKLMHDLYLERNKRSPSSTSSSDNKSTAAN